MPSTLPVDDKHYLASSFVDIGHDVFDQTPEQLLADAHGHRRCVPRGLQILCQVTQPLPTGVGRMRDVIFQVLKYEVFCDHTVGG